MRKLLLLLIISVHYFNFAQHLVNTGNLIQGGIEDGSKLVDAYIKPLNKAIVFGLSNVTYSKIEKQKKHKLSFSAKLAYTGIPKKELTYDVTKIGLKNFEPKDPDEIMAQTVLGDSLKHVVLVSKDKDFLGRPLIEFKTPGGSQKKAIPLPFLGITYHFNHAHMTLNFIPYVNLPDSDFKIGMIGLNYIQDLSVMFKSLKKKPFGLSVGIHGAYLFGHSALNIKPGGIYSPVTISGNLSGPYDNQTINISYLSYFLAIYPDYELNEHFSLFSGIGFNAGHAYIQVKGTYPVYASDPAGVGSVIAEDIEDPLNLFNTYFRVKIEMGIRGDWNRFYVQLNYNLASYGGLAVNLGYKLF